jgi:hypothetical protein
MSIIETFERGSTPRYQNWPCHCDPSATDAEPHALRRLDFLPGAARAAIVKKEAED